MKLQSDTFNNRNTLDMNSEKIHKSDLGLSVPENYFANSKKAILAQAMAEESKGRVVFFRKKVVMWSAAAVVALLLTLTITNPFSKTELPVEDDILLASMVTEESDVDALLTDFVNDELLTEEVFTE